jgi:hypothetical protein
MSSGPSVWPSSSRSPAAPAIASHRALPSGTPTTAMSCTSGEWTGRSEMAGASLRAGSDITLGSGMVRRVYPVNATWEPVGLRSAVARGAE